MNTGPDYYAGQPSDILEFPCNVQNFLDFTAGSKIDGFLGAITQLSFAGQDIAAELNLPDPRDVSKKIKAVGILDMLKFDDSSPSSPFFFSGEVVKEAVSKFDQLKTTNVPEIEVSFIVIGVDEDGSFISLLHSGSDAENPSPMKFMVAKSNNRPLMQISNEPIGQSPSRRYFQISLDLKKTTELQPYQRCYGGTEKTAPVVGISVGA